MVFMFIDLITTNYAASISHTATAKNPYRFYTIQPAQYEWDTFHDMIEEIIGLETLLSPVYTHAT